MSDNLYLFANNNGGIAENLSNYRLYDMKIDGDVEQIKVDEVNYVDCLIGDGASYIDTGKVFNPNYKYVIKMFSDGRSSNGLFGTNALNEKTVSSLYYNPQTSLLHYGGARTYDGNLRGECFYTGKEIIFNKGIVSTGGKVLVDCTITIGTENSTNTITIFKSNSEPTYPTQPLYLYYWKVYDENDILIQDLKPCLDTTGVPCMYDEISKQYFYNQGTGTFKYKKSLRDFQPVLDSNNVPCLLDKIKNKFYYDKNGNLFNTKEKIKYKKLDYIQGDGASWINTNIIPNISTKVVIDAYSMLGDCLNGMTLFGSIFEFLSYSFQTMSKWLYVGKLGTRHSVGDNNLAQGVFEGRHIISVDLSDTINVVNIDGINYGENKGTTTNCTMPILLFNRYDYWGNTYNDTLSTAKIYSFKIYQSDELVLDLIPVLDQDNVPCMYDKVSDTFFYNQGTGEFSYGIEELDAPPVDYVEYLKSDLNSYIDTGKKFDNTWTRIESKYKCVMGWADKLFTSNRFLMRMNYGGGLFQYKDENNVDKTIGTASYNELGVDKKSWVDLNIVWTPNNVTVNNITKTYEGVAQSSKDNILLLEYSSYYIYYWKVYDANNQLIQDLRPCLDKDGTPCMYDTVSQQYFYNQGTGEFLHGDRIGYTPIEYIESTGTQYIDTEVVPTSNTDIEMTCRVCDYNETPTLTNSYIMNGLQINNNTYQYNSIDTTVQPNLVASTGATLTMGSTNLALLDEDDIETATNNGWSLV